MSTSERINSTQLSVYMDHLIKLQPLKTFLVLTGLFLHYTKKCMHTQVYKEREGRRHNGLIQTFLFMCQNDMHLYFPHQFSLFSSLHIGLILSLNSEIVAMTQLSMNSLASLVKLTLIIISCIYVLTALSKDQLKCVYTFLCFVVEQHLIYLSFS